MTSSKNKNYFEILRPGINTTYQDFGRKNLYHIGIPFSGVMDKRNYKILNALLQNNKNSPCIEFAYQGPYLKYYGDDINFAITGNVNFLILKNGKSQQGNCYQTYKIGNGDEIDIQSTDKSVYGYFSINGTLKADYFWDSCSTNSQAKIGANNGNKISKGEKIFLETINSSFLSKKLNYISSKIQNIRVIKGTNFHYFSKQGQDNFFNKHFTISKLTDRMGMRLEGPKIENISDPNIKSEGLVKGVIQITSDGDPIIMLSDHGTIGGYPKIATVISADYDKLVQLIPGSKIKFQEISLKDAETIFKLYELETDNLILQL